MELLTLTLLVSSLTVLNWASPPELSDVAAGEGLATLVPGTQAPALLGNADEEDEEEVAGGPDFEDDDADDDDSFLNLADSKGGHVDSLMHVHHKGGEILVPCFGMWWPVGGGGGGYPVYEYVDDYYGDYKKKRRSRKRKRAKAKRKKS